MREYLTPICHGRAPRACASLASTRAGAAALDCGKGRFCIMKKAFALVAAALVAAPAYANHRDIEVDDNVFIPSARIGIDLAPRGQAPSVPHTGHGIEIGFTGTSGEDSQARTTGAPTLVFGGQAFAS